MIILLRIVLWISLWITLLFTLLLSATNRRNSDLPIRKQSEKFRFLSVSFFSSYIYYYYLTYIYLNRLSSSSILKAFNRKNRNFSDFPLFGLILDPKTGKPNWSVSWWSVFSGSKNVDLKDFSRPSAPPRPAKPAVNATYRKLSRSKSSHKWRLQQASKALPEHRAPIPAPITAATQPSQHASREVSRAGGISLVNFTNATAIVHFIYLVCITSLHFMYILLIFIPKISSADFYS